jgi:hypothetical protein
MAIKDLPADVAMAPPENELIPLDARSSNTERLVAGVWNKSGNLLRVLAESLEFEPGAAVAVFSAESGGAGFGPEGRLTIRFENHHFYRHWGKAHRNVFDAHYRFDAAKTWTGHRWRASAAGAFERVHKDQNSEWRAFDFARALDDTAAKLSVSMGAPQILGSNYAAAGFESVHEMFQEFSASERAQIVAFFTFLQGTEAQPRKVMALQRLDFVRFAELYNGAGNAAVYGARIGSIYESYRRLRPSERLS